MSYIHPAIDADGLLEYSVVFNDRSVNHMSKIFQTAMRQLSSSLKSWYQAKNLIIVPGGGTFGMEAIARQFVHGHSTLVLRHGWFSYRWTQIFEALGQPHQVIKARPIGAGPKAAFAPAPLEEVLGHIAQHRPRFVFAPHVETASGIILPDHYLKAVAAATHAHGGLFVVDGIASGTLFIGMQDLGIDVYLTAPQKGLCSSPGAALVLLSAAAADLIGGTTSSSFAMDLKKWRQIMEAYENGGHAYHATLPTDTLMTLSRTLQEIAKLGPEDLTHKQRQLGQRVRALLPERGFVSVAAPGYEAPGVVVAYCDDELLAKGSRLQEYGIQAAAGVPLMCDEPVGWKTFRVGLFGLDKLLNIDRTVDLIDQGLRQVQSTTPTPI